ncbi:MAG: cysteine desulfurase [Nitrososphaerales archaeon]
MCPDLLDPEIIKQDFPIFKRRVYGKRLIYLDNAATTQKPRQVIEAMREFYQDYNANIHRGVYRLSVEATEAFENARKKVAKFINAKESEIIFTKNATEALNLVAYSWGLNNLREGDHILLTEMEHHSNIVPWQLISKYTKAKIDYISIDKEGLLVDDEVDRLMEKRPKIVSITHVSNVLGTINNVKKIVEHAHKIGAITVVDAAQSVPHMQVDVQEIGCDFLAFSGHKALGPLGVGVLYGKRDLLEDMNPFLGGGDMISRVWLENSEWNELPWKFEAGTSSIADVIGLGAAVDYLNSIGISRIRKHEIKLTKYALETLSEISDLKIYGTNNLEQRGAVISFNLANIHPHDLATILDEEGIALRAGHHCAMPLMNKLGVAATARASFYLYNAESDVDALVEGLNKARRIFKL